VQWLLAHWTAGPRKWCLHLSTPGFALIVLLDPGDITGVTGLPEFERLVAEHEQQLEAQMVRQGSHSCRLLARIAEALSDWFLPYQLDGGVTDHHGSHG